MTDRSELLRLFLTQSGWGASEITPLAGDASNRRYDRLRIGDTTAVLMDAPPAKREDVRPFVAIATHLTSIGLSAPRVLAQDIENGFLVLEDLGDDLYARLIQAAPDLEQTLYRAAVDVLVTLHQTPCPAALPEYTPKLMSGLAALAVDWYALENTPDPSNPTRRALMVAMEDALARHCPGPLVLIQRDYHSENLLWLPKRSGAAKVGLLDFQDAMAGHPAYDLVSLLTDARRDVPASIQADALAYYLAHSGVDTTSFTAAYATLGVQRNLRILGVFARLSLHYGKAHYVDLIPRVWSYLLDGLTHPALAHVRPLVLASLPAPDAKKLQGLKEKCGTIPTR